MLTHGSTRFSKYQLLISFVLYLADMSIPYTALTPFKILNKANLILQREILKDAFEVKQLQISPYLLRIEQIIFMQTPIALNEF